jgi:hypothetical protein
VTVTPDRAIIMNSAAMSAVTQAAYVRCRAAAQKNQTMADTNVVTIRSVFWRRHTLSSTVNDSAAAARVNATIPLRVCCAVLYSLMAQ